MPWAIEYRADTRIVRIEVDGRFRAEHNPQMVAEVLAAARQHDAHRLLIDCRNLEPGWSLADLYFLPNVNLKLGVDNTYSVAMVYANVPQKRGNFEFLEDRAYNAGAPYKFFTDHAEAEAWLCSR